MPTYVISDIHGRKEKFYQMLDKINFNEDDTLYVLGDVVDRGAHGIELFEDIMAHPNMKMLTGNHEQMAVDCFDERATKLDIQFWRTVNNGEPTYQALKNATEWRRNKILKQMNELPLWEQIKVGDQQYFLVHAGLVAIPGFTCAELAKQQEKKMTWIREDFYEAKTPFEDAIVVAGHTDVTPGRIWHGKCGTRIVVDAGDEHMACLRLDDMEEFYL